MRLLTLCIATVFMLTITGCKNEGDNKANSVEVIGENDEDVLLLSSFGDQPAITNGPDGVIGLAFGHEQTIYYSESDDGGRSFSEPAKVGSLDKLMLGYSSGPQIAMTQTHIVITAPSRSGNLFSWSMDRKEAAWDGPNRINDVEKSAEECLSSITSTQNGLLFCTWIDTRFIEAGATDGHFVSSKKEKSSVNGDKKEEDLMKMTPLGITKKKLYEKIGDIPENAHLAFHDDDEGNLLWVFLDTEGKAIKAENHEAYKAFKERNGARLKPKGKIYISSSNDGGRSWTKSRLSYQSPDGSVCECCKPSIESDSNGNLFVMFRNNLNGSRDLHYMKSTDNGVSFSEPQKLGSGTWKINGCPMDGGGMTLYNNGDLNTIWQREGRIYLADSDLTEQFIEQGRSPSISSKADKTNIVFTSGEDIMAVKDLQSSPTKIGNGNSPRVLTVSDGVIYVWVNGNGIQYKRV